MADGNVSETAAGPSGSTQQISDFKVPNISNILSAQLPKLSEEGQVIVSTISLVTESLLKNLFDQFKNITSMKDTFLAEINELKNTVKQLEKRNDELSLQNEQLSSKINDLAVKFEKQDDYIQDVDAYERRDCVIISGGNLPKGTEDEDPGRVARKAIKDHLKIDLRINEINVCHRLGKKNPNSSEDSRPIIIKLHNRPIKYELRKASLEHRETANLFVNESLTPYRRTLFYNLRRLRKQVKDKIQQCYTHDGIIYIKLKNENKKYPIKNDKTLNDFFEANPDLLEFYRLP